MIRPSVVSAGDHRARILRWMLRLGCTTRDVANAAGIDYDSLRHFLRGRESHSNPTCQRLVTIYTALESLRGRERRRLKNEIKESSDQVVQQPDPHMERDRPQGG